MARTTTNERNTAWSARPARHAVFATGCHFTGVSFSATRFVNMPANSLSISESFSVGTSPPGPLALVEDDELAFVFAAHLWHHLVPLLSSMHQAGHAK